MSSVVIDFEGFQLNPHIFVIKEIAFFDVNHGYHGRWSFLPPHPWEQLSYKNRKTFSWLTQHRHGLRWESGQLPYTFLQSIITLLSISYSNIYIKGLEKSKFLENLSGRNILNLNDFNCSKKELLQKIALHCPDHVSGFHYCSLAKAAAYATFIKETLPATIVISDQYVKLGTSQAPEKVQKQRHYFTEVSK